MRYCPNILSHSILYTLYTCSLWTCTSVCCRIPAETEHWYKYMIYSIFEGPKLSGPPVLISFLENMFLSVESFECSVGSFGSFFWASLAFLCLFLVWAVCAATLQFRSLNRKKKSGFSVTHSLFLIWFQTFGERHRACKSGQCSRDIYLHICFTRYTASAQNNVI